jgi:internalin A
MPTDQRCIAQKERQIMKKGLCFVVAVVMTLSLAACAVPSTPAAASAPQAAATAEPPQVVVFEDAVLEQMVRAAMHKPEGDILVSDAEALTELKLGIEWQPHIPEETQIQDISALAAFKNLETLDLSFHHIADISPLSGLVKLISLSLGGNPVVDITPLAALTSLRELKIFNCQTSDYSTLSKLTNLEMLMLDNSTFHDASVLAGLKKLSYLSMSSSQVKDVSALSGLTNLSHLTLANCPITDFSPLAQLYPNLQEKDFSVVASLRELGFVAIGENQQVESYKTEQVIIQVQHEEWGKQQNPDEVNAVILYKDHGTDKELGVIYYPDQNLYLVFSHPMEFRYTLDMNTKTLLMEYGEEQATAFLQSAYGNAEMPLEKEPIEEFDRILQETFSASADVLYHLPREVKLIDPSSLHSLGFVANQEIASYLFEQQTPRYFDIEVHNPDWGNWDEGGDVRYFTPLSDEYRVVVTYFVGERKFLVKADDNSGGGAGYYYYVDAKTHEDIWCSDSTKTVEAYFAAAYNNPEIKDVYLYGMQLFENDAKDSFGLTIDALFALPVGQ